MKKLFKGSNLVQKFGPSYKKRRQRKKKKKKKQQENKTEEERENYEIEEKTEMENGEMEISIVKNGKEEDIDGIFTPIDDIDNLDPDDRDVEIFKKFCLGTCFSNLCKLTKNQRFLRTFV